MSIASLNESMDIELPTSEIADRADNDSKHLNEPTTTELNITDVADMANSDSKSVYKSFK